MTDFRAGGHYHGPDGLNGRVRDGNGCGPASIVAGEPDGGRRSPPAASSGTWSVGRSRRRVPVRGPRFFGVVVVVADQSLAGRVSGVTRHFREAGPRRRPARPQTGRGGRGGQAAWLLGPVGCGGRPPCTPGLSTWSSSRSLRCTNAPGNLVSEGASRLDAFSAYPVPT